MRLFVGVELDDPVRGAAALASKELRDRLMRSRFDVDARWVQPENLHVTVWFIGEAGQDRAQEIRSSLEPRFVTPAFNLHLKGLGAFPSSGPPRVFWLGLAAGAASMTLVHAEVRDRLVPLGFEPEKRPYSPHVTLARITGVRSRFSSSSDNRDLTPRGGGRQVREVMAGVEADCGVCRVAAITLFRSFLSPKGSRYEPLLRIPLS